MLKKLLKRKIVAYDESATNLKRGGLIHKMNQ